MKNEGFLYFNQQQVDDGVPREQLRRILRTYVRNVYRYQRQKIYEILLYQYSDWERPRDPDVIRDNLMDMLGDGQITAPIMDLAHLHALYRSPTYMYAFHYPSRLDTYPRWAGGVHGDDMTNPNSPRTQKSSFTSDVENRFEELTWPKYDNTRQEYLHIGMRPIARHHYRANEMAFWLELLPKIHQSDDLPPEYHLLENYSNKSTFEAEGTRELNLDEMLPTTTTSTTQPPTTVTTTLATTTTTTRRPTTTTTPERSTTTRSAPQYPARTDSARDGNGQQSTRDDVYTTTRPYAAGITARDGTLSLSVTIAVGCSLLFLNILIFAGVYYQKDRLRIELKQRQRELVEEQQKERDAIESEANYRSSGADTATDTNSSSMVTPTLGPCMVRHQHHLLQSPTAAGATTLPKHSIPVITPQVPYHTAPRSHHNVPLQHRVSNHTPDGGTIKRALSVESIDVEPRRNRVDIDVGDRHSSPRTDVDHHGNPSTVV
ncbi:hypothetical protein LSH36_215g01038 [Paralvinella palmiformis]|uniref:Carboxylesterase type B domain-containing protein n=1 Tax=Paralvinella palmiformis TaxID=53620 RepID=A0AAD9JNA9_9ANNE|nr:hypothetical protein LSH36_215g01038 [Paralvinella palmiformis]